MRIAPLYDESLSNRRVLDMVRWPEAASEQGTRRKTDCIINDVLGFFRLTSANIKLHVNLL